jgi:ABC-type multidrug transport system permease subunit
MLSTFISLFCGFLIQPADFASFWLFMYWLDPMHYALEGLVVTQFHLDDSVITITGTEFTTTASSFVQTFYADWKYEHRGYAVMALLLFIVFFRYVASLRCIWSLLVDHKY